jgi:hypothetical protein
MRSSRGSSLAAALRLLQSGLSWVGHKDGLHSVLCLASRTPARCGEPDPGSILRGVNGEGVAEIGVGAAVGKEQAIRLMAEALPLAGYGGVRADLPGWEQPEIIHGAVRDHRPALFCESPKPVFLEVVAVGPIAIEEVASRWQLFSSAAELTGGEFHVVIPRWVAGRDGRRLAKDLAELVGVRIGYIWAI